MTKLLPIVCVTALAGLVLAHAAQAGAIDYKEAVARHAQANHVPEALVHRVIMRESKYHPELTGRGGVIGLMQIKLATAKGLGYTGDTKGLYDPETNLTYGVKYLAGAYRAAEGDMDRAVHYFAAGYYYAAKKLRSELAEGELLDANGNPQPPLGGDAPRKRLAREAPKDTPTSTTLASAKPSRPLVIVPIATKKQAR